jgi:hypothetical protein
MEDNNKEHKQKVLTKKEKMDRRYLSHSQICLQMMSTKMRYLYLHNGFKDFSTQFFSEF